VAGLFLLFLLVLAILLDSRGIPRLSPLLWSLLAAYAFFVAFSYLSILWAEVPGDAWVGANRSLLFGIAFAIAAIRPWSRNAGVAALALTGFGLLGLAVGTLAVGASSDPLSQFVVGRLSDPTGYANATAALFLMGTFPLIHLAAARLAAWPVRGLALGGAVVLLETALLTQSRGGALAVVIAAAIYLAVVPQRWPALLCLGVVVGLTALSFETLTALGKTAGAERFGDQLADVRLTIALSATAAVSIGALGAFLGGRLGPAGTTLRRARSAGLALVAAATIAAAVVAIGNPVHWTEHRWDDFRNSGYSKVDEGGTRFSGSLGSNRYDFYRVALDEFDQHPIVGIGAENFLVQYLEHRKSEEAPHFPHSLAFSLLAQLGVIGTAAFFAFFVLALIALRGAIRGAGRVRAGIAAAALATSAVWFAQGLVDWIWAFTGLGVIAFAMLAVAIRSGDGPHDPAGAGEQRSAHGSRGRGAVGIGVAVALALLLALPGIAARYVTAAYDAYAKGSPELALERLDEAAKLDFLSAEPLVAKGVIAQRIGSLQLAASAFEEGIGREPKNWLAHFELGMLMNAQGHAKQAEREVVEARRLNPRQLLIGQVLARIRRGESVDSAVVDEELGSRLSSKLRPLDQPEP
jgi:O-antigen ligase